MRNLKRALSLALASVMLLGMMVVGSSAAAGFPDVDKDDNVEAIEVLQAVEVMVGDDRGFGPDRPVTRNEMAVVMGKLLNLNYNYYSSTCPFTDVAEWARGWVGACYANGIVSGRGEGIYDGEATVTAVEAASMMMRALGYFKHTEDYADGFQLVTVRQGNQIGIFNEVGTDASTPMTRNQVAQMALNALRSEIVDFTGTPGLEVNGVKVGYKAEYTARTSTEAKYNAIEGRTSDVATELNHKGQYYVQLGEELYDGKLRLNNGATDDFGRPSRYWEYDGKAIGTYMKKELLRQEWTVEVTGKDFYDLLGADTIKKYSFDITIDGVAVDGKTGTTVNNDVLADDAKSYFDETVMAKTYKSGVGKTGKGVLTQVFVNPNTEEVDVAVINTYLAKAASDYNEKRDELKLNVYGVDSTGSNDNTVWFKEPEKCSLKDQKSKSFTVTSEDFDVAGMKKDDIVLITQANGEIKTMDEPQVISAATLNAFSKDNYVINDGTQYDYNTTIEYDPDTLDDYTGVNGSQQLKDISYNLYLDAYGYLIGVEVVEDAKNYIFLTGIDQGTSNLNNKVSDAAGILLDGTFVNFRMNMTNSKTAEQITNANPTGSKSFKGHALWNTWCTYTVDKDGTYTLTEVKYEPNFSTDKVKAGQWSDQTAYHTTIDTKRVALKAGTTGGVTYAYGNDSSVYIVPETKTVAARDEVAAGFQHPSDTTTPGATADEVEVGEDVIIISGVESRGTGIDTVSIKTWSESEIKANTTNSASAKTWPGNIYTLYDNDNYVIGAVVVGEDTGASKNWVYVNSDSVKRETYDSAEDEHTWIREVIKDGVSTDLLERGSGLSELKSMKQNTWYEVTYKADGSVKSVDLAYYSEGDKKLIGGVADPAGNDHQLDIGYIAGDGTENFAGKDFIDNVNYVEKMNVDGESTYLYEEVWGLGDDDNDVSTGTAPAYSKTTNKLAMGLNNQPTLTDTLYVDTNAKKGIYVDKDVKSVLIQKNDGAKSTIYGDGRDDLEQMLEDLNYNNGSYLFKISAVVKNGRATVVIIHDWNETDARGNDKNRPGNNGGGENVEGVKIEGGRIIVTSSETNNGQDTLVRSKIMSYLESNGYTLLSINNATTGNTGVGYAGVNNIQVIASKDGSTYTFNSDLIVKVPMVINGENVEKLLGEVITPTAPGTGYVLGTVAQAIPGAAAAQYVAGPYTVAWTDRASAGRALRTDTFIVTENGQTGGYYRVADELTLTSNTGKHVQYNTTKYAPIADGGKVTIVADMAGQTLTPGYFKISVQGDADKVDYVKDDATTTTNVAGLTGTWVKTDDSTKEYIKVIAVGGKINPADLTGGSDKITKDIEIIDQGYYEIPAATTNAGSATQGLTVTIADNAGKRYAKANEVVTYSVTIKGKADDGAGGGATLTVAGGDDAKVAPALDNVPDGVTGVSKGSNTTVTFAANALDGVTDGITVTVKMTVDNKDVSAAVTFNIS